MKIERENELRVIGITGGIGSGKSVVSRILRCQGFEVYDCDSEARVIMDHSEPLKRDIAALFGKECIRPDGSINRPVVGRHVFSDESKRRWLNSKVHELVRNHIASRLKVASRQIQNQDAPGIFFVESAILNTGGITPMCSEVWHVESPVDVRSRRVVLRDGMSFADVKVRIEAQLAEYDDFGDIPTVRIINDGSESLLFQIETLIKSIC
ncbi:MAG: dephospho-CoA kinase [Muribaculaceae bacterium]|nr:dephospho-CoA kinase [Muribaculaceae bacterium]